MKNLPQLELIWCRGALKVLQADLELFASCVRGYAEAHCDFVRLALEELRPLLSVGSWITASTPGLVQC